MYYEKCYISNRADVSPWPIFKQCKNGRSDSLTWTVIASGLLAPKFDSNHIHG